jgi:hypothetical protein
VTDIPQHTFHDKGMSLADLVASSRTWEAAIVPIGPTFRMALAAVTAAVAAATAAAGWGLDGAFVDIYAKPRLFLVGWPWFLSLLDTIRALFAFYFGFAALLLAGAVLTSGFAHAGRRLQIALAVIGALAALALLPAVGALLIPAANAIAYVVGTVVFIGFIGWIFFSMFE